MRELLAMVTVGLLAVSGCSRGQEEQPAPQTSNITVHVSDQAGIAASDVVVVANREISDDQFGQIAEGKTDGNGNTTLTLPENATVTIGVWKEQVDEEAVYSWQVPMVIPVNDASVSYSYWLATSNCLVVQPGPDPCPPVAPKE